MIFFLMRLFRRTVRHPSSALRVAALLIAITTYGATGFMYFEIPGKPDLEWGDAFWWAFVTLTTVGYGDYAPATSAARFLIALPLMIFGIGLLGYVLSLAAATLVEAKTRELTGMAKMNLERHVIIVNMPSAGKVERLLAELLHPTALGPSTAVVVIDEELQQLPPELVERNVAFVRGNPARDETLTRAAIDHAAYALVLSKHPGDPHSDNQTIAVALAIEGRNRDVHTVVECVDPSMEELLRKTGCDGIVCTSRFDAHFLGSEILKPGAQEVIDHLMSTVQGGQQLFITPVPERFTAYADLAATCAKRGHVAIGLKRRGKMQLNTPADLAPEAGDLVVTIGPVQLELG